MSFRPVSGFTLVELLISLALISTLSSLSAWQSITLFQTAMSHLKNESRALQQEADKGKVYRHVNRGFSMIELLIALMVMTMAVIVSTSTGIVAPSIIADAKHAAAAVEAARTALVDSYGTLTRVSLEDENFIQDTAETTWTNTHGESRRITLSAVVGSSTKPEACDSFTSGDWSHPTLAAHYPISSLGIPKGSYSLSSLAISPDMLAVGIASTSQVDAPALLLFRLTGTSSPQLVGMFDNASISRIGNSTVVADGKNVFSGSAFTSSSSSTCSIGTSCAQITVHSLESDELVSSFTFSTSSEPYAHQADGSGAPVSALTYYNGLLYTGLQKTVGGDEFNIVDAHNPNHLFWIGGYSIGRTVTAITVRGALAYLSTDDPIRELIVLDTGDPAHPKSYSTWDAPGSSTFGYGSASTAFGNFVRFGRTYSASYPEFELLQIHGSSTAEISEISNIDTGKSNDPESVRALLTQDRLTFMLLTHRMDVLETDDPRHVRIIGTYILPASSQGVALACRNNRLYLARNENDGNGYIDILQGS